MSLTFHVRVVHLFGMLKKKNTYTKYLCLLSQKNFPQAFLIWTLKLDVPKIGILPYTNGSQICPARGHRM